MTSVSGKTLASVPHPNALKALCVEEGELVPPPQDDPARIKVRLADHAGHRTDASFLVQRRYAWRGYAISGVSGALPNRITLSASYAEDAIATITVGLDSALGISRAVPRAVHSIQAQKRKVCEFLSRGGSGVGSCRARHCSTSSSCA
jgi:hypothetical protein